MREHPFLEGISSLLLCYLSEYENRRYTLYIELVIKHQSIYCAYLRFLFWFHAVKNITTSEGGAVVWRNDLGLDDEWIYHQFMLYSLHGQSKDALAKNQKGSWEYDIIYPPWILEANGHASR